MRLKSGSVYFLKYKEVDRTMNQFHCALNNKPQTTKFVFFLLFLKKVSNMNQCHCDAANRAGVGLDGVDA